MRTLIFLLILVFLIPGCQQYTPDNLPAERLRFGTKGGITGGGREYILLLENGRLLFDDEYSGELESVGKFNKKELAAVRADLLAIDFDRPSTAPGNYNTSLIHHREGNTRRIGWRRPGDAPTTEIDRCYDTLMNAVRRLRKD